MATNSQIRAALDDAVALDVNPTEMVALFDKTIAAGPAANGSYTVQVNSRGTAITYATLSDLIAARDYFRREAINRAGGVFGAPGEFVSGG